jgi:AraC-like DNA-binding protein
VATPAVRTAHPPRRAAYPPGSVLAWRHGTDHELVWIVSGSVEVHGGDAPVTLGAGAALLVGPGAGHELRWGGEAGCTHGYVHFDAQPAILPGGLAWRRPSPEDPVAALCRYLDWLGRTRPTGWRQWSDRVTVSAAELLAVGPSPGPAPAAGGDWPPAVTALLAVWARRWARLPLEPLTVGELAAEAAVSRTYLNRVVTRSFGRPVSVLGEQLRLVRAESMLVGTSAPLATIARTCGFADAFHLSRRFTHHMGVPPSTYRRGGPRSSLLDDARLRAVVAAVWGW